MTARPAPARAPAAAPAPPGLVPVLVALAPVALVVLRRPPGSRSWPGCSRSTPSATRSSASRPGRLRRRRHRRCPLARTPSRTAAGRPSRSPWSRDGRDRLAQLRGCPARPRRRHRSGPCGPSWRLARRDRAAARLRPRPDPLAEGTVAHLIGVGVPGLALAAALGGLIVDPYGPGSSPTRPPPRSSTSRRRSSPSP